MTLDEFEQEALKYAVYPNMGSNLVYATLGLCGEAGEAAEKVKKRERDSASVFTEDARLAFLKELGDVLWYVAAAAREAGSSLEEVAEIGLKKLADRANRGVLHGSGDNR